MIWHFFKSSEDGYRLIAEALLNHLNDSQKSSSIALAGGKSPAELYKFLHHLINGKMHGATWLMTDERYLPPGHPALNSRLIEDCLFQNQPPISWYKIKTELSGEDAARQYSLKINDLGQSIDVCILGFGTHDGHFAGLFPLDDSWLSKNDSAVYTTTGGAPSEAESRISLSLETILAAKHLIIPALNQEKTQAIKNFLDSQNPPNPKIPLTLLKNHPNLEIFCLDLE